MADKIKDPGAGSSPAPVPPAAKPVKAPKKKKETESFHLPVLMELLFTFSGLLLIGVFLSMTITAWLTGTSLLAFLLRTSAALLVLGALLALMIRQVSAGVIAAGLAEQEEARKRALAEEFQDVPKGLTEGH